MHNHKLIALTLAGVVSLLGTGCAADGHGHAESSASFSGSVTLVAIDTGVWVVRDYDQATYYVDDSYWVYRDGAWMRSTTYDGGWVKIEASIVPASIATRNHATFVHYRGDASAATRPAPSGGQAITSGETNGPNAKGNPHGGPPGLTGDKPGVGNERKADGEQPGRVPGDPPKEGPKEGPKGDPPGVGNQRKADGVQPGQVGGDNAGGNGGKKEEKKEEKKEDKKAKKK